MSARGNAIGWTLQVTRRNLSVCQTAKPPDSPPTAQEVGESACESYYVGILKPVLWTVLVAALAMMLAAVAPRRIPPTPSLTCSQGRAGSQFADVYSAFAPWFALHEAFAEYLFRGSETEIPADLSSCCEGFPLALARLQLTMGAQSDSPTAVLNARLPELLVEVDAFCAIYRPILETIDASDGGDFADLEEASDAGLFARIYELHERLEDLFTAAFDEIDNDRSRWSFAVAFTVRTLTSHEAIERIDEDLAGIFYGREGASGPPFPVPEAIAEAMAGLVALSGRDLPPSESERAGRWAEEILAAFVSDPDPS